MRKLRKSLISIVLVVTMIMSLVSTSTIVSIAQDFSEEETVATENQDQTEETVSENNETEDLEAEDNENEDMISVASGIETPIMELNDETIEITNGGTYQLAESASGTFVIKTTDEVVIVGNGVVYDEDSTKDTYAAISSTPNSIHVDCTQTPGAHVTLKDLYNSVKSCTANVFDFTGSDNVLQFEGTNVLDYDCGYTTSNDANIHVGVGTSLTICGSGDAYLYNCTQGAGIGGATTEMNGDITFDMTGNLFIKGTRQGAVIGAGARANGTGTPGAITFVSGTYNVITNSRGAAIGGSAGSGGGSTGTTVTINKNATVSVNTDYSGACVGGGGYALGNDSSGGTLYVNGGSIRPYVDKNAASNVNTGWQGKTLTEGVNDAVITAQRINSDDEIVYMCTLPVSAADSMYTVMVDGESAYSGNGHSYVYAYDGVDRAGGKGGRDESINVYPNSTIGNWIPDKDSNLYVWMTGKDHTVIINNKAYNAIWNEDDSTFKVTESNKVPVYFYAPGIDLNKLDLKVTDYATEYTAVKTTVDVDETETPVYMVLLDKKGDAVEGGTSAGAYSYTLNADGYYSSTCAFTVKANATVDFTTVWTSSQTSTYKIDEYVNKYDRIFSIELDKFTPSSNKGAWDGKTIDVSWFDASSTKGNVYEISTPAQLAGLAAIVNGVFNDEITTVIDSNKTYTATEYMSMDNGKIKTGCSQGDPTGPAGSNQVTSSDYYYNAYGFDFDGQTVKITADLDMGGYKDGDGNWTGARYMPIGGQYQMYYVRKGIADGFSHLGSSFCGTLDGQGHIVDNIYCDRYSTTAYGDSSTIGLIGRLGVHDADYTRWQNVGNNGGNYPPTNPTVRNVAVNGYIYGRRSVGGVVGKTGHTTKTDLGDDSVGAIVENCINFAEVSNTDSKGVGGIVGAAWNGGLTRNCVNFGYIHSTYNDPTGGIVGYNENSIENCYNLGYVYNKSVNLAQAISSNNGGSYYLKNNYWYTGSVVAHNNGSSAGYYNIPSGSEGQVIELTNKSDFTGSKFLTKINGDGSAWSLAKSSDSIYQYLKNNEYASVSNPVPSVFVKDNTILPVETTDVYRLYNPGLGVHHYTNDVKEKENLIAKWGWKDEGTVFTAYTDGGDDTIAVYRLYNPGLSQHLLTSDTSEVKNLTSKWGWKLENNNKPCFYLPKESSSTVSIYRLYNPYLSGGEHLYTTDKAEYDRLPKYDWRKEGVVFYGVGDM